MDLAAGGPAFGCVGMRLGNLVACTESRTSKKQNADDVAMGLARFQVQSINS